jgi:hypothetical protein
MKNRPNEIAGVKRIMVENKKNGFLDKAKNWVIISAIASAGIIGMNTDAIADDKAVSGKEIKEDVSSNNFYMGRDLSLLPPGLQHCRDKVVALVYGDIMYKWNLPQNHSMVNRLQSGIGIAGEQVNPRSKYLEPALYLAAERFGGRSRGRFKFFKSSWEKELLPVNAPLYFFAVGLDLYFEKWIYKTNTRTSNEEIEKNFLKSIYTSVNVPVDKVSEKVDMFYSASLIDKEREIEEIVSKLIKLGPGDKKSYEPANAYNRRLVAAWSSFLLTDQVAISYEGEKEIEKFHKIINKKLEIPIRSLDHSLKMRGPPFYFDSEN